jgi:hypothetical protein
MKLYLEQSTMRQSISIPQKRIILQGILDFVVCMVMFVLSMVLVLWLMVVLEPGYFANWFLP